MTIKQRISYRPSEDFQPWYLLVMGYFYFGQGYALSSLAFLLPLYLLNELHVLTRSHAVTISAIMVFPWYIKFVPGMISDNFPIRGYRRKPYFIIATLFSAVGWLTLGLHQAVNAFFFLSGVSLALGSAIADATIDGQAVEITPERYIGRLQGVAWGSRGLGIGSAGIISAILVDTLGWQYMFNIASIFGISMSVVVLILPEMRRILDFKNQSTILHLLSQLREIFTKTRTKNRIAFFFSTGLGLSVVFELTLIMETEFGYSYTQIGWGALIFAIGSFLGSVSYGIITDRQDTMNRFILLSVGYGLVILSGMILLGNYNNPYQYAFFFLLGLFGGAYEAYQLRVIQEETVENLESTIFAIWTGISNLGQLAAGVVIVVSLADLLGISILLSMQLLIGFLLFAVVSLRTLKFS